MKSCRRRSLRPHLPSPPSRGAWIEILRQDRTEEPEKSPPSRGAWIEIVFRYGHYVQSNVAPLAGGVD